MEDEFDAKKVREHFEEYFLNYFGRGPTEDAVFDRLSEFWLNKTADGRYEERRVDDAWTGWLAAERCYSHKVTRLTEKLCSAVEILRAEGYETQDMQELIARTQE